nr:hypothetical protein [Bacillota bacterium]
MTSAPRPRVNLHFHLRPALVQEAVQAPSDAPGYGPLQERGSRQEGGPRPQRGSRNVRRLPQVMRAREAPAPGERDRPGIGEPGPGSAGGVLEPVPDAALEPAPPPRPLPGPAVRRSPDPPLWTGDITLEPGYTIEAVAAGLTFPSDLTFDDRGRLYVAEAGVDLGGGCVAGVVPRAAEGGGGSAGRGSCRGGGSGRILRVEEDGSLVEVAAGFEPPLAALTWHDGAFYVAEGRDPARIVRVWLDRGAGSPRRETVVDGLRAGGDHGISQIAFGPDGKMYFAVGSATNAGVVGIDNQYHTRWLAERPDFRDVPARDLVLRGLNFPSVDPREVNPLSEVLTGPFLPFGQACRPDQRIRGDAPANGVLYEAGPDGGGLTVFLDGVRHVTGLGFSPDGRLYFTEQGFELRGSRPIAGVDALWEAVRGGWYGFPDYSGGVPVIHPRFRVKGYPPPDFVLSDHPPLATQPAVVFQHGSGPTKFDFSPGGAFGYPGWIFVPLFGPRWWEPASTSPGGPGGAAGSGDARDGRGNGGPAPGFRLVRVNVDTGRCADLLVINRPAAGGDGPWRPAAVRFTPDGSALYLLDYGPVLFRGGTAVSAAAGGALWRIWSI